MVVSPATLVTLGDLRQWPAILCLFGFVLIVALTYRRIVGGILIGVLLVSIVGVRLGLAQYSGVVSMPLSLVPTLLQLDFSRMFELTLLVVVFSFLIIDVFDNAGTLIGVAHRAGLLDRDGNLRVRQALIADNFAAMFGSLIGTSTTTSYIESAAGVSAGGRTGLTAAFVAMFFLMAPFFSPLAGMVPAYASAAALLYVACVMMQGLAEIAWDDITEYAPAVVAAVTMPLTYSIATGIGLGFITCAAAKLGFITCAAAKLGFITCAAAKLIAGKFAEAVKAVASPELRAQLIEQGSEPQSSTPEQLAYRLRGGVRPPGRGSENSRLGAMTPRVAGDVYEPVCASAFLMARKSRQANRLLTGLRSRNAG